MTTTTSRLLIAGLLALATTACASLRATSCAAGQTPAVQELVYFGTDKPQGQVTVPHRAGTAQVGWSLQYAAPVASQTASCGSGAGRVIVEP